MKCSHPMRLANLKQSLLVLGHAATLPYWETSTPRLDGVEPPGRVVCTLASQDSAGLAPGIRRTRVIVRDKEAT